MSGAISGSGGIIFSNAAAAAANTVTLSGSIDNSGSITNVSVLGDVVISGAIGANVTGIVRNSTDSILNINGAAIPIRPTPPLSRGTLKLRDGVHRHQHQHQRRLWGTFDVLRLRRVYPGQWSYVARSGAT